MTAGELETVTAAGWALSLWPLWLAIGAGLLGSLFR